MHPQIADIIAQFDRVEAAARTLAAALDDAAFARRPAPGKWSPAECIAHLNLTTEAYLKILDAVIVANANAPRSDTIRYRKDVVGWLLTWIMEPPYRSGSKTGAAFVPGASLPREALVAEFARLNGALCDRARSLSGLDLNALKVASPFGPLKYNTWSAFTILAAHERRHLWQAERNRS